MLSLVAEIHAACLVIEQRPDQCECAHNRTVRPEKYLPRCTPSALCVDAIAGWREHDAAVTEVKALRDVASPGRRLFHTKAQKAQMAIERKQRGLDEQAELQRLLDLPPPPREGAVTFVVAYSHDPKLVRYWYAGDPFRSYLNSLRLISRLVLSLRAVRTLLPIHLLLSGERHAGFEAALTRQLGVNILSTDSTRHRIKVPKWASAFHKSSFIKLAALSLVRFQRVVLLDDDTVVLRNVDHLALVPPPAFAFRFKCVRLNGRLE